MSRQPPGISRRDLSPTHPSDRIVLASRRALPVVARTPSKSSNATVLMLVTLAGGCVSWENLRNLLKRLGRFGTSWENSRVKSMLRQGLMHRSKEYLYSITLSAHERRADSSSILCIEPCVDNFLYLGNNRFFGTFLKRCRTFGQRR